MRQWHRREHVTRRLRLRGYDYSTPGGYFVTICTEHRRSLFGNVEDELMVPSPAGVVIESWWCYMSRQFPSVTMDEYIVMPNHFHGILILEADPHNPTAQSKSSLNEVVHRFKGMSTRDYILGVRTEGWPRFPGRLWQQGFYEHIIRNDASLERLRTYIESNPSKWPHDEYNTRNQ